MARVTKPKLLPAPKDAGSPPTDDTPYVFVGEFYLYEDTGDRWKAWKIKGKKHEPMGVAYRTSGDRWGLFCTRVSPTKLMVVGDDLASCAKLLHKTFG
jgi:hypothetical protein